MGLFKNEVGRPSNETLKKRRIIYLVIIFVAVIGIGACVFYTVNYFKNNNIEGTDKNISAAEAKLYVSGNNNGFTMDNKYYSKGTSVPLGSSILISNAKDGVGSNVIFTSSDGKTKLDFKGEFGKDLQRRIGSIYSKIIVQTYNSAKKVIATKSVNIKSSSTTATIAIPKNTNTVRVAVLQATFNGQREIFSKTINVSAIPTIANTSVDKANKNSNGIYIVSKNGENKIKYNINTSSGRTMYYSVFLYDGHSFDTSNVKSTLASCVSFNSNKTTPNYSVTVNSQLGVKIRIYADANTCKNDIKARYPSANGNNRQVLVESNIKISPKLTTTNKSKYIVLANYSKSAIGKNVGTQIGSNCFIWALKYGAYIMGNGTYTKTTDVAANYNATSHNAKTTSEIYDVIVKNIDNGKPVVIHVYNSSSSTHYVTVVGYKRDKYKKVDSLDDLWIIDPYPAGGESCKGKKDAATTPKKCLVKDNLNVSSVMWEGKASDRTITISGINSSKRYLTW